MTLDDEAGPAVEAARVDEPHDDDAVDDALRALRCLYLAVDADVVPNVTTLVRAAFAELNAEIAALRSPSSPPDEPSVAREYCGCGIRAGGQYFCAKHSPTNLPTYTRSDLEAVARMASARAIARQGRVTHYEPSPTCPACADIAAEVVTRYLQTRAEK